MYRNPYVAVSPNIRATEGHIHSTVALLHALRKKTVRIQQLKREYQSILTFGNDTSAQALLGRIDRKERALLRARLLSKAAEIDAEKVKHQSVLRQIRQLEVEIAKQKIKPNVELVHSPSLHINRSENKKPTGFEDLPGELRNMIYEMSKCLELQHTPEDHREKLCKGDVSKKEREPQVEEVLRSEAM